MREIRVNGRGEPDPNGNFMIPVPCAVKMTKAQARASEKLTGRWQCAYTLGESIPTLEGLVRRGIAEMRRESLGSMFSPRTSIFFRLKTPNAQVKGDAEPKAERSALKPLVGRGR